MTIHGSNSMLNIRLTLQSYLNSGLLAQGYTEDKLYLFFHKRPDGADLANRRAWAQFRMVLGGAWDNRTPILFQVLVTTQKKNDPTETELDTCCDVIRDVLDVASGVPLLDYRNNPLSPTPVTDPDGMNEPVVLAIREEEAEEVEGFGELTDAVNSRVLPFAVYHWRFKRSI